MSRRASVPEVAGSLEDEEDGPIEDDRLRTAPKEWLLEKWAELKAMNPENALQKRNGMKMSVLKKMAELAGIKKSVNKRPLVFALYSYLSSEENLERIIQQGHPGDENTNSNNGGGGSSSSTLSIEVPFRKDINTFPRLCNILMRFPVQLLRSQLRATRSQLQFGQVYSNQDLWKEAVDMFNDDLFNSGGLSTNHAIFEQYQINPELKGRGRMSNKYAYDLFNSVCRLYRIVKANFDQSGQHNNADFFDFCQGSTDVLYLHLTLVKTNNSDIMEFCLTGQVIPNGVDTAASQLAAEGITPAVATRRHLLQSPFSTEEEVANGFVSRNNNGMTMFETPPSSVGAQQQNGIGVVQQPSNGITAAPPTTPATTNGNPNKKPRKTQPFSEDVEESFTIVNRAQSISVYNQEIDRLFEANRRLRGSEHPEDLEQVAYNREQITYFKSLIEKLKSGEK